MRRLAKGLADLEMNGIAMSADRKLFFAKMLFGVVLLSLALALIWAPTRAQEKSTVLVFAAASLSNVLEEIGDVYEIQTGNKVIFSFAGSMTLARQTGVGLGALPPWRDSPRPWR